MSEFENVRQVRLYWEGLLKHNPPSGTIMNNSAAAIGFLLTELDKQQTTKRSVRKLAKTVPLRVTLEQFRTISDSRVTCTLLVTDKRADYNPGMLAIVMEFDQERARFTQRQTLRIISHVWQAVPGYDADTVILALQPVEDAR